MTLAATSLLMGIAGGPHCVAMCGPACVSIAAGRVNRSAPAWQFQTGRLVSYCTAGAVVAGAVEALSWLTRYSVLQPVWIIFHLAVFAWGLVLVTQLRQPQWVESAGRSIWKTMRPLTHSSAGGLAAGVAWVFMPCGLLYSALLVASLTNSALEGAWSMALFAAGSSLWLTAAPMLWRMLDGRLGDARKNIGTRLAGFMLVVASLFALWMDLQERLALWC